MQILKSRPMTDDKTIQFIDMAASDCGRVHYYPIGNDRIIIDGRDVYRKQYTDNGQTVDGKTWRIAKALMLAVDSNNQSALDTLRDDAVNREIDRYNRLDKALAGTRGTYVDNNTF